MTITIEQLSKATKLSESTIRVYASQRNLGKKIGNKRVFTEADVQRLLKGTKKSPPKKTPKAPTKKTSKRGIKTEQIKVSSTKPKATNATPNPVAAQAERASFWTRLLGGRKQQQKVGLMDAKTTK